MPDDKLPQDEDALEAWRNLPQGKASRDALPPAAGGSRLVLWLMGGVGLLVLILVLLSQ